MCVCVCVSFFLQLIITVLWLYSSCLYTLCKEGTSEVRRGQTLVTAMGTQHRQTHTHTHTHIHTNSHKHTQQNKKTHTQTHISTRNKAKHTRTHTNAYKHNTPEQKAHIHTNAYTLTHKNTHTYKRI